MKNNLLISIFVPVYNGALYLEETLTTIKEQTYKNLEVLLVDDSSTDGSLQILNEFAQQDSRFHVYVKENGGTVPHSMNFVLPKIMGDYFFYASQDDLFSLDIIEQMVKRLVDADADCVLPDMEFYFENGASNKQIIGLNGNKNIELSGREACQASINWTIHGFALFKSSLIKAEYFPEDAFDSDEYVTRKLFFKSKKVVFSDGMFYYRQDNLKAITKTFSKKNFYRINSSWKLFEFLKENTFDDAIVFNSQLHIIQEYLHTFSLYQAYHFESENDKEVVKVFLLNFKNTNLIDVILYDHFSYIIRKFKLKYLILIWVLKTPLLFRIFMTYKLMKSKLSVF